MNEYTSEIMTMEEMIDTLKGLVFNSFDRTTVKERQALDMAIRMLENEQTDGDLISRNDVINMFNTMDRYKANKLILQDTDREFPSNEVFIVDDCYELLEQLPTYSAEQTAKEDTAKWIKTEKIEKVFSLSTENNIEICSKYDKLAIYKCSNCGYKTGKIALEYNYCPKCGIPIKEEINLNKAYVEVKTESEENTNGCEEM